ncbi:hypothetical protein ACJX0J_035155, partial [Zea mays]
NMKHYTKLVLDLDQNVTLIIHDSYFGVSIRQAVETINVSVSLKGETDMIASLRAGLAVQYSCTIETQKLYLLNYTISYIQYIEILIKRHVLLAHNIPLSVVKINLDLIMRITDNVMLF